MALQLAVGYQLALLAGTTTATTTQDPNHTSHSLIGLNSGQYHRFSTSLCVVGENVNWAECWILQVILKDGSIAPNSSPCKNWQGFGAVEVSWV
jgi:hypothetical protein